MTYAFGYRQNATEMRKIAVSFDDETFVQVRDMAHKNRISFAEQVRQLVEWGLEAVNAG